MNTFTRFLGHLVEHLGPEQAAQLVHEFAGQTITFPGYDDYGFPEVAPLIGQSFAAEPPEGARKESEQCPEPRRSEALANVYAEPSSRKSQGLLSRAFQVLLRREESPPPARSAEPSTRQPRWPIHRNSCPCSCREI